MTPVKESISVDPTVSVRGQEKDRGGLLILACHAIYQAIDGFENLWWGGLGYEGEQQILEHHVHAAFRIAKQHDYDVLCASGGRTRPHLDVVRQNLLTNSEGAGVLDYAQHHGLSIPGCVAADPFARDSLENVLHSLLKYYAEMGCWPARVGVVSFGFKVQRFSLVALALGLPSFEFHAAGQIPPAQLEGSILGELNFLAQVARETPGGGRRVDDALLRGPVFSGKRAQRTPAEFGSNSSYIEAMKQHYENDAEICHVLDVVEAIKPGDDPRSIAWPWARRLA